MIIKRWGTPLLGVIAPLRSMLDYSSLLWYPRAIFLNTIYKKPQPSRYNGLGARRKQHTNRLDHSTKLLY